MARELPMINEPQGDADIDAFKELIASILARVAREATAQIQPDQQPSIVRPA